MREFLGQNSRLLTTWNGWTNLLLLYATTYKKQCHSSIQSWHIADLVLGIIFDMYRWAWTNPYEWTESIKWTYVSLITCKKSTLHLSLFLRYRRFVFWIILSMPDYNHLKCLNKSVLSMDAKLYATKQIYNSTHSWDEAGLLFGITSGMLRRTWTHPIKITG